MSDAVATVAARVRELDVLLAQLTAGRGPGGPLLFGRADEAAPGSRFEASIVAAGTPAAGPSWTEPFATLLREFASPAGAAVDPASAVDFGPGLGVGATGAPAAVVDPIARGRISRPFRLDAGEAGGGHDGLDIAAPLGTPVRAMAPGLVRFAGRLADGAVAVRVEHADGSEAWYGHLDPTVSVRVGDRVAAGDLLGQVGLTGRTTGPHLHLELWYAGRPIDPEPVLRSGRLPGAAGSTAVEPALRRFDAVASTIPYADEIRAAAVRAGIDPLLLAALVRTESGFRRDAVSRAGAMGLSQLMPATAQSLGVTDPFDPAQNLDGGARYLAGNLRIFGRVDLALAAYQAGKAAVRRAGGIPESPVTRGYVARVLETWARYLSRAESGR